MRAVRFPVLMTLAFLVLISIPWMATLTMRFRTGDISKDENRVLAQRPGFDPCRPDSFPPAFEKFYNDHFLFRGEMIRLRNRVVASWFGKRSPEPDLVAVGSSGWLFSTGRERAIYEGKVNWSDWYENAMVRELRKRAAWYKARGISFFVTIVPMKSRIYPEYLPKWFRKGTDSTLAERVAKRITGDSMIRFTELQNTLVNAKPQGQLFYKTDSHWNGLGAWIVCRTLIKSICTEFPGITPLPEQDIAMLPQHYGPGDLSRLAGLQDFYTEMTFNPVPGSPKARELPKSGYPPPKLFGYPAEYEQVRGVPDTTLPRIVVIRDSFFSPLLGPFSEHFSRSVFLFDGWHYGPNYNIIEKERPDIVLLQVYEPHLVNIIYNFTE